MEPINKITNEQKEQALIGKIVQSTPLFAEFATMSPFPQNDHFGYTEKAILRLKKYFSSTLTFLEVYLKPLKNLEDNFVLTQQYKYVVVRVVRPPSLSDRL